MQLFEGIFFHGVGAASASLCYTPQKRVKGWSWQTYWLAQASVCWLFLPFIVAILTIPSLGTVLATAPHQPMLYSFLLGMAYGIGGTAFGISIKYIGFSLTYAISVGISCVLGTLISPLMKGTLQESLNGVGGHWIIIGVVLGVIGIAFCGLAGRLKEKDISKEDTGFSFAKGLPLCLLAGVLSAFYEFSISAGKPISDVAAHYGAGGFQVNVVYLFSNTGAFLTTCIYTIWLHAKNKTFYQYSFKQNEHLGRNYLMALCTGILWYGQFFFYGLGHVKLGKYEFSSWAIHMIMLVFFSSLIGVILKEWKTTKVVTRRVLVFALFILLMAVVVLTFGNYLGGT